MNGQSAGESVSSVKQPPYWEECKKMDFAQLRQFIDDSLRKLSAPGLGGHARSKEEFLTLWELLRGKIDVSDLPALLQQRKVLLDKREQLGLALAAEYRKLSTIRKRKKASTTEQSIRELQRKRWFLERDINLLYAKIQKRHPRRLQIIERVRKDIESAFKFGAVVPTSCLPWRVLPPGELSVKNVLEHYGRLQRLNPHIRYERDRIIKAYSLNPNQVILGIDEFEGYVVLTFAHTPRALLECPVYGNAIYIIDSDWKRWSRMTKQELLVCPEVTKIVHKGDWFWRVKRTLGIRCA